MSDHDVSVRKPLACVVVPDDDAWVDEGAPLLAVGDLEAIVEGCELALWLYGTGLPCDGSRWCGARDPPGLVRRAFGAGPRWLSGLPKCCASRATCGELSLITLVEEPGRWYASRCPSSRGPLVGGCIVRMREWSALGDAREDLLDWLVERAPSWFG